MRPVALCNYIAINAIIIILVWCQYIYSHRKVYFLFCECAGGKALD